MTAIVKNLTLDIPDSEIVKNLTKFQYSAQIKIFKGIFFVKNDICAKC